MSIAFVLQIGTSLIILAGTLWFLILALWGFFAVLDRLRKHFNFWREFYSFLWHRPAFRAWLKDRECKS